MKSWLLAALLVSLASKAEDKYLQYDATVIKRFEGELRRLGITVPAVTVPEKPVKRPVPIVSCPAGTFEGHWIQSQFGRPIVAFEGIPYAQPPVGPLRFKLANPLTRLRKPLKASKRGSQCMQLAGFKVVGQEDCLFINVYVPEKTQRPANELLPVIFYVHGGAFVVGQGAKNPGILLEKDVVFVTFNYRLGPLGFLTTEDDVIPANIGIKDQVLALKWTVKNIASFGGNPNLITVSGSSAGAASTEFLMLSPLTKGLIHRAISASGSAYCPWALSSPGEMRQSVRKAAQIVNCPAGPSTKLYACLQSKNASEITLLNKKMAAWGQALVVPFKIVVEGKVPGALLPKHPKKLFANRFNDIPLMTGSTSEEGSLFGMMNLFNNYETLKKLDKNFVAVIQSLLNLSGPEQKIKSAVESLRKTYFGPGPFIKSQALLATKLFGDTNFMWPTLNSVESHVKGANSPVYYYYFNYKGNRKVNPDVIFETPSDIGVHHSGDQAFLSPFSKKANPMDLKMAMIYSELYVNFARNGVPTTKLVNVTWTPVSSRNNSIDYLYIYTPSIIKMKKNLFPERWALLNGLLKDLIPSMNNLIV